MDETPPPRQPPSMPPPFVPAPARARDRPPPLPRIPGRPTSLWQETLDEHQNTPEVGEIPFGGWLIVIAIGRVLAIPISLFTLFRLWRTYSAPGLWSRLTSPDSPRYHPLWAGTIVYEVGGQAIVCCWCIVLVWLFFRRKKAFRAVYIIYSVVLIAFLWGDHFILLILSGGQHLGSPGNVPRLIGQTIGTLIWALYFIVSERVRETFVR